MSPRLTSAMLLPLVCSAATLLSPIEASAQPATGFAGSTFAERWAWADVVVVAKCTKSVARQGRGKLKLHDYTFQTSRVVRGTMQSAKAGEEFSIVGSFVPTKVGDVYLVFRSADRHIGTPHHVAYSDALLAYIRQAPVPAVAPSKRMGYFFKNLNSKNILISNDALVELAGTAAKHYVSLPKSSVDLLESTVLDTTGAEAAGNERLIAGYFLVRGEKGLDRYDAVLKSKTTQNWVIGNAISALDFVWRNGEGRIPQERMRRSLRLLIGRAAAARQLIRVLTNWKDWASTDRIAALYGTKGYTSNAIKYTIINYLLSAETHLPKVGNKNEVPAHVAKARKHLAAIQKRDPGLMTKAKKSFNPKAAIQVTWRQGKLANPKIDKVATGLSGIPVKTSAVHVIRFHPDSKTLLAGSGDGSLRNWHVANGQRLQTMRPHTTWLFTIAHSADGKRLATGSGDTLIKIFGTESRNLVNRSRVLHATLNGHTNDVHAVAFGPKRETLYSAGDDMVLRMWDLKTRTIRESFEGHTEAIPCLAISPDGSLVATGSRDDSIRIWDARTGKLRQLLDGHGDDVHSVAFSPDGKTLVSASYDETVKLWDVASGNLKRTLRDHANWVFSVAYSPDGKQIASADKDGRIVLWDAKTGKKLAELKRQKHVSCVTFSPNGQYLASSAPSGLIALWSVKTRTNVRNLLAN